MYYAKTEPKETIREHTDKLLENLKLLRKLYGRRILENTEIDEERFWKLLEIVLHISRYRKSIHTFSKYH